MMSPKSPDERQISAAATIRKRSTPTEQFLSARHLKWSITILLVYFGLRLLFLSVTISQYVPPDEETHFGLSRIYSEVFFLPENSPETYQYGLVTNIPYLYYWVMGKMLALNLFGIPDLIFLRLLNIPIAFATIYFVRRMHRLLTDNRLSQILLIVAVTNTLMFSFLCAFVSNDNLTNLLAAMAVYYLLAFFKTSSGDLLAVSFLCQMAGCLTKYSFFPLVLVLNILLVIREFKSLRVLPSALPDWFKAAGWRRIGLVIGISLGLALNVHLYGGNYIHYGNLTPEMSDVLSPDKAMQNRIAARNVIISLFKEGRISRDEALAMTSQINHPGDRSDTIYLIKNYIALKNNEFELLGPLAYAVFWVQQMSAGIFGILGHLSILNQGPTIWPFAVLSALTGLGILLRWRPSDAAWLPSCLMAIAAFFGFFLLYGFNYQIYLYSGALGWALQGRYLFPVLGPIYAVSSYYLPSLFRSWRLQLGVSTAACVLFIASDFPYFLSHVTSDWFVPPFH
jgi:hypothetical protein